MAQEESCFEELRQTEQCFKAFQQPMAFVWCRQIDAAALLLVSMGEVFQAAGSLKTSLED